MLTYTEWIRGIKIMYFRFLYDARNIIKVLKMVAIITLTFKDFIINPVYFSRSISIYSLNQNLYSHFT